MEKSVLSSVLKDAEVVFFCASASAGWRVPGTSKNTPKQVDYLGAIHVAEAAAQAKVKRLILVSSAMVTNRSSFPYLFLNSAFGRISEFCCTVFFSIQFVIFSALEKARRTWSHQSS